MKKRIFCILIALMLICGLAACKRSESAGGSAPPARTTYVSIGTAGTGGYFNAMGAAIANIITRHVPGVEASAEITGGSSENATLVGDGELEMGLANGNIIYWAYNGMEPYTKKYSDLRSMFAIQSSILQLATMQGNGISSINDLRGRRVVVGPAGGGQILLFSQILSIYGMTFNDIRPIYISYTEGVSELIDGNCDALLTMGATPTAAFVELAARTDRWRFVEFGSDALTKLVNEYSYFVHVNVETGTYRGQPQVYHAIAASSVMIVNAGVADNIVYAILEEVYKNLGVLVNTLDSAKEMTLETGWYHPILLHPGAEKFFRDKGVMK